MEGLGLGDSEQTLADGWANQVLLHPVARRENETVEGSNGVRRESSFPQHLEVEPPSEVPNYIKIDETFDLEACLGQFEFKFGPCVPTEMAEVLVDGGIDFRSCRDKEAGMAVLSQ
jgi:hypothetical protein